MSVPASNEDPYSIPRETDKLFREGLLRNPLISKNLPPDIEKYSKSIKFEGSDSPSIPINWRFAEGLSALKALEGAIVNLLLKQKYGLEPQEIVINTDHAQLFIMSPLLWTIDPKGDAITAASQLKGDNRMLQYFPNCDLHRPFSTFHRSSATNIYMTKDGRYFHLHGGMNPDPTLESISLPHDMDATSAEESYKPFIEKLSQIDSQEMQRLASDVYRQAGTICWTTEEYLQSEHGKANADVGLFEIHAHPNGNQKASWWPDIPQTSAQRPLAGLKVVDLSRVIAGPAVTRGLAELGASVMRVTAPHITDYTAVQVDMNWGKWNAELDFREEGDREKMRALILEADVLVSGYRPGVLDKYGFGQEGILELCKGRDRGIIYVRENCYGWNGPWAYRTGWQQISDACCGVSMEFGRAMGNDEPVTPVFPNSDYSTGIVGTIGTIEALLRRAKDGGSYTVDIALNYYSQWLINTCGVYPPAVWSSVWSTYGREVFRHYHNMNHTLPHLMVKFGQKSAHKLFRPGFFEDRPCGPIGKDIRTVKPILEFPQGAVKLGYNVGTRTNGVDQPRWPEDLMAEIVA